VRDVPVVDPILLDSQSSLSAFLVATAAAADCFVGFADVSSVLFRGSPCQDHSLGVSLGSNLKPSIDESFADQIAIETEQSLQAKKGLSRLVELSHLLQGLSRYQFSFSGDSTRLGMSSHYSSFLKFASKAFGIASQLLSNLGNGQSGFVEFDSSLQDKIHSTSSRHVIDLPVFDVSTQESVYVANGILSSNCMCSYVPAGVGESTEGQKKSKFRIEQAVLRSVKAEVPVKGRGSDEKRSLKTRKAMSTWAGAGKSIAKKRPKSVIGVIE